MSSWFGDKSYMNRKQESRNYPMGTRVVLLIPANGREFGELGTIKYYGISRQTPQGYLVEWDSKDTKSGYVFSDDEVVPPNNAGCKTLLKHD